jgi:hypothetical protein
MPPAPPRETRVPELHPAAPSAVEVSSAAIERLRSSIPRSERPRAEPPAVGDVEGVPLSPNGPAHAPASPAPAPPAPVASEPRAGADERPGGDAVETLKASRLDFLFRSRPSSTAPSAPANAPWTARQRSAEAEPQRREEAPEKPADVAPAVAERRTEAAAPTEAGAPTVLKSGVVDGMAYTLYSDGSIEAKLPQGTVRFGSIAELRAHIESNA